MMDKEAVPRHRLWLFWSIALVGAAADLVSKTLIFAVIGAPGSQPYGLIGHVLELRTNYNPGALWGWGRDWQYSSLVFAGLSLVAAFAICYWLFVRRAATDRWLTVALALIMAGALGNCFDRLFIGQVRDFVHFHVDSIDFNFPIFNFADSMLVVGAGVLMLLALRPEPLDADRPSEARSAPESAPVGG
jgi:signal peptidase II